MPPIHILVFLAALLGGVFASAAEPVPEKTTRLLDFSWDTTWVHSLVLRLESGLHIVQPFIVQGLQALCDIRLFVEVVLHLRLQVTQVAKKPGFTAMAS